MTTTSLPTGTALSSASDQFAASLAAYQRLFVTRLFPTMRATKGSWYSSQTHLKRADLERAMTGVISLGFYAVSERGNGIWLALDADTENDLRGLAAITATFDGDNLLLERSRRGGHLWVFTPPTPWEQLHNYGRYLVSEFGLRKTEVFPKGPGLNAVKAPGSKHPKTGKTYDIIDHRTGEVLPLLEALRQIEPHPVPYIEHERRREAPLTNLAPHEHGELVDLLRRYTTLTHQGGEHYRGLCPMHDDHHPSLSVIGGWWKCWTGCGSGGLNALRARLRERGML